MKHHVMLDIDGTLLQSYAMDEQCFVDAVRETTGLKYLQIGVVIPLSQIEEY